MTCLKKIQNTEVFGSKFSSRTLTTAGDISAYTFKAVVKNNIQGKILEIPGIKNAGTINFDFSQLETLKKSTYKIEYWGDFGELGKEPFLLEELSIVSAENATNCSNSDNLNFEINFEEISIPVTITKAINNFYLDFENLTAENIESALGYVPQEKLTEDNVGQFMDSELSTKSAPTSGDTVLGRDSVTGKAVKIPTSSLGGNGNIDTSNLVPYTGANKDVNIASNYFNTSKGFDFTKDADNYFRTFHSDGHYNILEFSSLDTSEDNFGKVEFRINPEEGLIFHKYSDSGNNSFQVTTYRTSSRKKFVTYEGFEVIGGTANQSLTANGGVFDLNKKADLVSGKVPASQLPAYVDDVLEFANLASFPATGESGKIYIAIDTNLTYRWGGSSYVVMSSSLALGETSSTAYRGDRGKIAYDHSQTTGNLHGTELEQLSDVSGDATTIIDDDVILKKESGGLWKKLSWSNIIATLKTYFDGMYAPKAFNVKVTTPSSYVTGTLAETEVLRIEIPANSISDNSFLNMPILFISKLGTNGNISIRGKLSTLPTMPSGATDQIFQFLGLTATNQYVGLDRKFIIESGQIKGFPFSINSPANSINSNGQFSFKSFDRTVTNYLYVSIQLFNTADQARLEGLQLTNS